MGKKDKSKRLYNISDAEMFQESKTKRGFFIEDKADFILFDADFSDPYAANWLTAITNAEALLADETLDDQGAQLTGEVEKQMTLCRDKFQDSKYFIEKAFPANVAVWNEFGYDNYNDARRVQLKLVQFMKSFHSTATKYSVQLIAKNYTQLMIDEIATLRTALDAANQAQELFLGNLGVQTQTRYLANNTAWNFSIQVCTAGKRIYKNDYAKYQRYLLPPGEESPEALSITGIITDAANGNPLQGAHVEVQPGDILVDAAANGRYSIAPLPDGEYSVTITLAGYNKQTIPVTLTDGIAVTVNVQLVHL